MNLEQAFKELRAEVLNVLAERIAKYGINNRAGKNTLQGSELEKSIEVRTLDNGIVLQIADYWEFVSLGWRRTNRYEGTMAQFIENVGKWIDRKGIQLGDLNKSQMTFVIIRNIMENGIKARPFMVWDKEGDLESMIPELKDYLGEWFDRLFESIMEDIDKHFK